MISIMDTVIDIGGMFRCCVATIDSISRESPDMQVEEGHRAICTYCDQPIHYTSGAWRSTPKDERDRNRNFTS